MFARFCGTTRALVEHSTRVLASATRRSHPVERPSHRQFPLSAVRPAGPFRRVAGKRTRVECSTRKRSVEPRLRSAAKIAKAQGSAKSETASKSYEADRQWGGVRVVLVKHRLLSR